jgi:hypothetical protein
VLIQDILYLVQHYFQTGTGDLDHSGVINIVDIQIAVRQYSIVCPT